eukprot:12886405-Prorocentrum_lima.AAC.1
MIPGHAQVAHRWQKPRTVQDVLTLHIDLVNARNDILLGMSGSLSPTTRVITSDWCCVPRIWANSLKQCLS